MNNNLNEIKQSIINIIEKRLSVNIKAFGKDVFDEDLTGSKIQLKARELLWLHFEVEKEFKINIPEHDIIDGYFNSINNIAGIVSRVLANP